MNRLRRGLAVVAVITALVVTFWVTATGEARGTDSCSPNNVWGFCFDTLPRLYCCSGAYLGWSGIYVGDSFPLFGRMAPGDPPTTGLQLVYPSGKTVDIPLGANGSFRSRVTFDEEGPYRLIRVGTGTEVEFYVAYQVKAADATPSLASMFGAQHSVFGNLVLMAPAAGGTVRVQFTDGLGRPARNQSLHTKFGDRAIMTEAEGVAEFPVKLETTPVPYPMARIYPGLVVQTFREFTLSDDGTVADLPGGSMSGVKLDGQWYFGLREFLTKVDPWAFPTDQPSAIAWDGDTRTASFHGLTLMVDTGGVLKGRTPFRVHPVNRDGRMLLPLPDLVRIFDEIGYADMPTTGVLRIASPFVP